MKIFSFLQKSLSASYAKTILRKIEKPSVSPPKRPITAYLIFAGGRMASAIESESDADARQRLVQAARKVSLEWRTMSAEEKKPFFEQYESAKRDYEGKLQEYLSTRTLSDAFLEERAWSLKKQSGRISVRPIKDVNKPVRPLTSFLKFASQVRANPSAFDVQLPSTFSECTSAISKAWKVLDSSKKEEYLLDYQERYSKYKSLMEEYDANISSVKDSFNETVKSVKNPKKKVLKKAVKKAVKKKSLKLSKKKLSKKKLSK